MHHETARTTVLDPHRHHLPHFNHTASANSSLAQSGWPQPARPSAVEALDQSFTGRGAASTSSSWLSSLPASTRSRSNPSQLPTPPSDDMLPHGQPSGDYNDQRQFNSYPTASQTYQQPPTSSGSYSYYPSRSNDIQNTHNGRSQAYSHPPERAPSSDGTSGAMDRAQEESARKKELIHPSLQIPSSVNNSGGSLPELASRLTCLFWFESVETLQKAEKWSPASSPLKRLAPDANPTAGFRKWVTTILTTTQVTPSVVLLALLFIYRLKTTNPTVKGKTGSEYRLLTVALMLGNKFLDDNTYTNKTWAEVSGIAVAEIHVMEVEFLSNMRYSLLASEAEWEQWLVKIGKFDDYFQRAAKVPVSPTPIRNNFASNYLPAPTTVSTGLPVASPSAQLRMRGTDAGAPENYKYSSQQFTPTQLFPQSGQISRKRSFEDVSMEPAAKRPATATSRPLPAPSLSSNSMMQVSNVAQHAPRLPVPNLSNIPGSTTSSTGYSPYPQGLPALPPMNGRPNQHGMITPAWTPQPQQIPQQQLSLPPLGHPTPVYSLPSSNQGTPSRRLSPRSVAMRSINSSPTSGGYQVGPNDRSSPSVMFQQRNSPYKPVRLPNTLLYPPPSTGFSQYQPPPIEQMHYQPLGRPNDYRTGVIPEYRLSQNQQPYWQPAPLNYRSQGYQV